MRISTQTFYSTTTARMSEIQSGLMKTQQQIQSGKKNLTPADDPVAAAKAISLTQSKAQNEQYGVNRQNVKDPLQYSEVVLDGVVDLLHDVKDIVLSASNGTISDADRKIFASDIAGRLDQLFSLANSTDASGNPIFSGFETGKPAFTKTATGAVYNGDQGQRNVQVDTARQLASNDPGDKIFQGGNDIFKTLTDLVGMLNTPVTTAAEKTALTANLTASNVQLTTSMDNVLTVRASIGSRLKEIDTLDVSGSARGLYLEESLSDVQGLDYVKAITDLTQQKTMLDAAQQSFAKISGMSLFDYMR